MQADFVGMAYNYDFLKAYFEEPALTLEEAYTQAFNFLIRIRRAGYYGGWKHDNAEKSLKKLGEMIVQFHLQQSGYELTRSVHNCKAYLKFVDDS